MVFMGKDKPTIIEWEADDLENYSSYGGHFLPGADFPRAVLSLCYSKDGEKILSASCFETVGILEDKKVVTAVKEWDCNTKECIGNYYDGLYFNDITSASYRPDEKGIIFSSKDCSITEWNIGEKKHSCIYRLHKDSVTSVCYSPDGEKILSGSKDGTIRIWLPGFWTKEKKKIETQV